MKTLCIIVKKHGIYCSNADFQEYRDAKRKRETGRDGLNIERIVLNTMFEVQYKEQKKVKCLVIPQKDKGGVAVILQQHSASNAA